MRRTVNKFVGFNRQLSRWFGDLPVIEAQKELRVQPNSDDIKNALKNDPANCAFSRACQRMWDSKVVLFFGHVAYVDLLGKEGKRRVERFMVSSAARQYIKDFDDGKTVPAAGFVLMPPSPSQTIEGRAAAVRAKRKALLKGRAVPSKKHQRVAKKAAAHARHMRVSTFRSGRGMVYFSAAA